jgi:hypothetical protein
VNINCGAPMALPVEPPRGVRRPGRPYSMSERGPPRGGHERQWSEGGAGHPTDPEGVSVLGRPAIANACRRQVRTVLDRLLDALGLLLEANVSEREAGARGDDQRKDHRP